MKNKPPFQITPLITDLSEQIAHELSLLAGAKLQSTPIRLRRENKIKTIQASLAIEGNNLTIEQISAIAEGNIVVGPVKDIQEARNAIAVYNMLTDFDPLSLADFKNAHNLLMQNLIAQRGAWRLGGVAVFNGKEIAHMAPPAGMVPQLMEQLFSFIQEDQTYSWIIKACVFHYELEFIHPFIDGNGRMARLWQQLLLMKQDPVFEFVSVETIIKNNQAHYYEVLAACDKLAESTLFIEFSLQHILTALQWYTRAAMPPK